MLKNTNSESQETIEPSVKSKDKSSGESSAKSSVKSKIKFSNESADIISEMTDFSEAPSLSPSSEIVAQRIDNLPNLLEAVILAAGRPISEEEILKLFVEFEKPNKKELRQALKTLQDDCESRGIALVEMASGYQFQVKLEWAPIVARLWEEKAPKYSRALFETLALIAYRQPITRGEIEEIRGVSLSLSIFKTLLEDREWIRVVGHKEVPGRPALYATTRNFLDYFGLKSLEELPSLPEIMNLDTVELQEAALAAFTAISDAKALGDVFAAESNTETLLQTDETNETDEAAETDANTEDSVICEVMGISEDEAAI